MTETEHTHGPWRVGYSDGSGAGEDGFYCITASDTECVVRSGDSFGLGYGIENAADARLIAAAPDMLEALQRCVEALTGATIRAPVPAKEIEIGLAAIAKARG